MKVYEHIKRGLLVNLSITFRQRTRYNFLVGKIFKTFQTAMELRIKHLHEDLNKYQVLYGPHVLNISPAKSRASD